MVDKFETSIFTFSTIPTKEPSRIDVDKFKYKDYIEYIKNNYLYKTDKTLGKELKLYTDLVRRIRHKYNLYKRNLSSSVWELTPKQKKFINDNFNILSKEEIAEKLDVDIEIVNKYTLKYFLTTPMYKELNLTTFELFFIHRGAKTKTIKELAYIMDLTEEDIVKYLNWVEKVKGKKQFTDEDKQYILDNRHMYPSELAEHFSVEIGKIQELFKELGIPYHTIRKWTDEETELLISECGKITSIYNLDFSLFPTRTEISVYKKAYSLKNKGILPDIFEKREKLTIDTRNRLIELYTQGKSRRQIAEILNIDYNRLDHHITALRREGYTREEKKE